MSNDIAKLPDFIHKVISHHNLLVEKVLRDGPRYWVALVRQDDRQLILKAVINNETWESPRTRKQFSTSDQLRAEIMALRELGRYESELTGGIPHLIDSSNSPETWTLREVVPGADMSATTGSLIFRPEFYDIVRPAVLIDYILSYQRLTSKLHGQLLSTPKSDQTDMASRMILADLDNAQIYLAPYQTAVRSYLSEQAQWHDSQRSTLAHGEVYPPHILFNEGRVTLIDWENASLKTPMADFAAPWLRAFDNPSWQDEFSNELWNREWADEPAMRRLWDIELIRQSAGTLNYLYWSQIETVDQKALAVASMQKNIEDILGPAAKSGL